MSNIAIRLDKIGKEYKLGISTTRHRQLRETLAAAVRAPFRALSRNGKGRHQSEKFWALHDVSCEIKQGEVVGVIGRNGAGKSTLLKILSRITEPTRGTGEIHGRVGSLLEVGTGFHPELTGRENVFLNGAILGMRRTEIMRKFDEIVAFSELEKFIDTPVKHYSSGMYMRLAFAVAAHLDPEILIIDEVLAVGDVGFQAKCLGKMEGVARDGRTVVFVSHNMGAVGSLCTRAIYLSKGIVFATGPTTEVIPKYLDLEHGSKGEREVQDLDDDENKGYKLRVSGRRLQILCGEPLTLEFEVLCPQEHTSVTAGLEMHSLYDAPVVGANSHAQRIHGVGQSAHWKVTCNFGVIPLNAGTYYVSIWIGSKDRHCTHFVRVFAVHVEPADPFGWGRSVPKTWGSFYWKPNWDIREAEKTPPLDCSAETGAEQWQQR